MSIASRLTQLAGIKSDIKTALHAKGQQVTDDMTTYAAAIGNLDGDPNPVAEDNDVIFVDYDGKIRYSYTREQFLALTALPPNPVHEGLTAQGWNWSLNDAKSVVQAIHFLVIGQNYITDDGKTRIFLEQNDDGPFKAEVVFRQSVANAVVIDWGDGSEVSTSPTASATVRLTHDYSSGKKHTISINVIEGTVYFGSAYGETPMLNIVGPASNNDVIDGWYSNYYLFYCVKKIQLGANVVSYIGHTAFKGIPGLEELTIPDYITDWGNDTLMSSPNIKAVIVPKNNSANKSSRFGHARYISTSKSCRLNSYAESKNYQLRVAPYLSTTSVGFIRNANLRKVGIPSTVTSIAQYAFTLVPLRMIVMESSTPPTLSGGSSLGSVSYTRIFVPYGSRATYIATTNWSDIADSIFELHQDGSRPSEAEIQEIIAARQSS